MVHRGTMSRHLICNCVCLCWRLIINKIKELLPYSSGYCSRNQQLPMYVEKVVVIAGIIQFVNIPQLF